MAAKSGTRNQKNEEFCHLLQRDPGKAIAYFYDHFSPTLFGVAFRILGSEALAEDAIQDTFIKVWQHRNQYDPKKGTIFTWLLNITRRIAIDRTRTASFKREKRVNTQNQWENPELNGHHWTPEIDTIGLRGIVNGLEKSQKEVIDLVYFQGMTHKEVHEKLNIPLGTVKSRIRLAMQKLRALFDDQCLHLGWLLVFTALIP
jgi:RNA polymerase sigma-70 factor (ECF subfamily)